MDNLQKKAVFPEGFYIVDKPATWTSHDVVAKMRGITGIRKIGHLGTLDPLATGVLVLAVGKNYTKLVPEHMGAEKEYELRMELYKTSNTYDVDGEIVLTESCEEVSKEVFEAVLARFQGVQMQVPPAFSAKKINGRRAYSLARAGKEVSLPPKEVFIEISDLQWEHPFARFKARVSSGTYIRSLVHDIGRELGVGAVLCDLRRLRVGSFMLSEAKTLEEFQDLKN